MEFNTTQSFVKSLEGVRDSGILEEPVLGDVSKMIDLSYQNGTIDESVAYFNEKYPYYIVKNMNQLFLYIYLASRLQKMMKYKTKMKLMRSSKKILPPTILQYIFYI